MIERTNSTVGRRWAIGCGVVAGAVVLLAILSYCAVKWHHNSVVRYWQEREAAKIVDIVRAGKRESQLEMYDAEFLEHILKEQRCAALITGVVIWTSGVNEPRWHRLRELPNLASVDIYSCSDGEGILRSLNGAKSIKRLSIYKTRLKPGAMKSIAAFPSLVNLHLGSACDDVVPLPLKGHAGIETIWLEGIPVSSEWLSVLKSLPNLRTLNLLGTKTTPKTLERLRIALPRCEIVGG